MRDQGHFHNVTAIPYPCDAPEGRRLTTGDHNVKISTIVAASVVTAGLVFAVQANNGRKAAAPTTYAAPTSLGAPMTRAERHELIRTIAKRWSAYVRQVRKVDPAVWGRSMGAAFAGADPANLRRAAQRSTYEGMIGTLLGYGTSDAKVIDTLARDSSLSALQALASPAATWSTT